MDTNLIENLNKAGKISFNSFKSLFDIHADIVEQLAEQQLALFNLGAEYSSRQLKSASQSNDYKDFLTSQSDVTAEVINKAQGILRNSVDILSESRDEMENWYDSSVKETEKFIKDISKPVKTVKTVKKAA